MKMVIWNNLTAIEQQNNLLRPALTENKDIKIAVNSIIHQVKSKGDNALIQFTEQYDRVKLTQLKVTAKEINIAFRNISPSARNALEFAKNQIEKNHTLQIPNNKIVEISQGVFCERQVRPIEQIGLYIPGGSAPLASTVLMLGVPAYIAGCSTRILCTPPNINGEIDPSILVAAELCGIQSVYKVGGAQAIAAMAYGTETIPKVEKIFGPGNSWVTQAKMHISQDVRGASIDMPAGPSELMIIADDEANPVFIAADLLSQAEHGVDSQVMLITLSKQFSMRVELEIEKQLRDLPRKNMIMQSLTNSHIIVAENVNQAISISNLYGPEHLILHVNDPDQYCKDIKHAGAVFLGPWTPETLGDYVTGSNHVLPTYGYARQYSGLSVTDFMKFISFQKVTKTGLEKIGGYAEVLAEMEGLLAHKRAVSVRLENKPGILT